MCMAELAVIVSQIEDPLGFAIRETTYVNQIHSDSGCLELMSGSCLVGELLIYPPDTCALKFTIDCSLVFS